MKLELQDQNKEAKQIRFHTKRALKHQQYSRWDDNRMALLCTNITIIVCIEPFENPQIQEIGLNKS